MAKCKAKSTGKVLRSSKNNGLQSKAVSSPSSKKLPKRNGTSLPLTRSQSSQNDQQSNISSSSPRKTVKNATTGSVRPNPITRSSRARKRQNESAHRSSSSSFSPSTSRSVHPSSSGQKSKQGPPPTMRASRFLKRKSNDSSRSSSHSSLSSSDLSSRSSSSDSSSCSSTESDYSPPEKIISKRGRPSKKVAKQMQQSPSALPLPIGRNAGRKTRNRTNPPGDQQSERFSRTNCPPHIKDILKTSFNNNKYASEEEIGNLEKMTKLSRKDILYWFKRERQIKKRLAKLKTMSKEERVKFCEKRRIYRWKKKPENQGKEVPENLNSQRDRYPEELTNRLEQLFEVTDNPTIDEKKELAEEFKNIGITLRKVTKWFRVKKNKRDDPNFLKKKREQNDERERNKKAGTYDPKKNVKLPDGLPLDVATPILEEFFAEHPENSNENHIELNRKIGWSITRIKTWYYSRRREEKNNGKVIPRKSNGSRRNQEFYFTEEIFKALKELFEKRQFLEKNCIDLDGIVPLATAQTWFYRKRAETLDAWMNGKLKELPWQMKKMEEYYSKSCFIEDDQLQKLSKQINLSRRRVSGYFESRRTFDRKAGKDIPTEEEKKEKEREELEKIDADSEPEREEDEDEEAGYEYYDDEDQKVEMEDYSDLDSHDDDILEDDDYDEEDEFIDDDDEEEDFDIQHNERGIRRMDAPKVRDLFLETLPSTSQSVSKKIRRQHCPKEMIEADELLVEQLDQDFQNGDSLNYHAIPQNNQNGDLNWRFEYTCLPHNRNTNYTEWTNEDFIEFGSQFLTERSLEILRRKKVNGSHAKNFLSEIPYMYHELNREDFDNDRQPSFTWEEYRKVKHHLNVLFSLVDPVKE